MWNGAVGDLEAEADEQQRDADRRAAGSCRRSIAAMRPPIGVEVRRAGGAVHQRDAVEQERRRERAEQEVLERALGRRARCGG